VAQKYTVSPSYVPFAAAFSESIVIPQTGSFTFIERPRSVDAGRVHDRPVALG